MSRRREGAGAADASIWPNVDGIMLIGRYGANAQHTLLFVVEADDVNALQTFLFPGFTRCTVAI